MGMPNSSLVTSTTPASAAPSALALFHSSLKRIRSAKSLALHQKRLQYLAQNFDPFAGATDNECQQILSHYHLEDAALDPFQFTNVVLQMLDALEEKGRSTPS